MGRPPIVKTPQAVIDGAVAYIEHCEQRDGAPCLAGLARWLGYARHHAGVTADGDQDRVTCNSADGACK